MKKILAITAAAVTLATAGYASNNDAAAHHAFAAEFDNKKPLELQGVITKSRWVNPHSWVYVDVTDAKGNVTNWGFEFTTPNALLSRGINRQDLSPGASIRIKGYRAKNAGPYGYANFVVLHDGREIKTGGAPDAPAAVASR